MLTAREMVMVSNFMRTATDLRGIGNTVIRRVKAYSFILTVQVIKGIGRTTKRKVMAYGTGTTIKNEKVIVKSMGNGIKILL